MNKVTKYTMHIFIDESGNFVIPDVAKPKISSVTSLTVPGENLEHINIEFLALRKSWGFDDEVKGSQLSEKQISDVILLLRRHDVLVEVICLDIGTHSKEGVDKYKVVQANKLLEHITEEHHEKLVAQLHEYRDRMISLPNQLFLQAMASIQLMKRILEHSTIYYSQHMPKELGEFNWSIDAKNANVNKTDYEELWSTLLMPILETNFKLGQFENGDYSYFSRYEVEFDDMTEHQKSLGTGESIGGVDIKKLISECLSFDDSATIVGLQLVDIISGAFNRAMNGNLGLKGWRHLGALMVKEPAMVLFDTDSSNETEMNKRHMAILLYLIDNRKPMLLI